MFFLQAHDNQIRTVATEIGNLELLQKCDLSRNKIIELPAGIFLLKRLTELNLCHNCIEQIPADLGQLNCLRTLVRNMGQYAKNMH